MKPEWIFAAGLVTVAVMNAPREPEIPPALQEQLRVQQVCSHFVSAALPHDVGRTARRHAMQGCEMAYAIGKDLLHFSRK